MPRDTPLPLRVSVGLHWIVSILDRCGIEYQISGGVAARFYGSRRSINDIDIDIHDSDFMQLQEVVRRYAIFGPEKFIDSEWMILLMTLRYRGQMIDITAADSGKLFDENKRIWTRMPNKLGSARIVAWKDKYIRLMRPSELMAYKHLLHGDKQKVDIDAIRNLLREEKKG